MPEGNFLNQDEIDALLKAVNDTDPGGETAAAAEAPPAPVMGDAPALDGASAGVAGRSAEDGGPPPEAAAPPAEETPAAGAAPVLAAEAEPAVPAGGEAAPADAGAAGLVSAACGPADELTAEEKDALGEIGNISMGAAATTLSELLGQKVTITSPRVVACRQEKLFRSFKIPYIIIQVEFKEGLQGFNVLIIQLKDAMVMADLMMGGDGTGVAEQISEMELSAASEAMNQMIGSASTSLATMFRRTVNISPPTTRVLEMTAEGADYRLSDEDPIVVVSFKMTIGNLVDTEIMQIMSLSTAREEAALLLGQLADAPSGPAPDAEKAARAAEGTAAPPPAAYADAPAAPRAAPPPGNGAARRTMLSEEEQRKLELLLDIPLQVSVVLGRSRRPIKDVLGLTPGAIVELSSLVDEPVEVLVNGTLVARGEVVVVNENFGVRITSIISPEERVERLGARH